jgi:hypothetical protein
LNIIERVRPTQPVRAGLVFMLAALAACGGRAASGPSPANPEATVRAFLEAVKANNLNAMRELWGTDRGPASTYMDGQESEQRLTVIRAYLEHEKFAFDAPNSVDPSNSAQRLVRVRLTRKGCEPVVPFVTIPWKGGWLVKSIDLAEAGNPARSCAAEAKPGT